MQSDKILGKIIALTKEIHLKQPSSKESFVRKFLYQKNNLPSLGGAIGLEWWITKKGLDILEDIGRMVNFSEPSLMAIDNESFCGFIEGVLEKNSLNEEFFCNNTIFLRRCSTLFEGRAVNDPHQFASLIWDEICNSLRDSMVSWFIIYPLHRIKTKSVNLGFSGLTLLNSNDSNMWNAISGRYPDARYWSPATGKRTDRPDDSCFCGYPPLAWLICEIFGKDTEARILAGRHMRTFLSIMFSCLQPHYVNLLTKSMAQEISYSMQFPNDGQKAGCGQICAFIGNLLPPLITDLEISDMILQEIQEWYKKYTSALEQKKQRCTAASLFINYGIVSEEVERFLHFFIALDALFGERGKVEKSILQGVEQLFPKERTWIERGKRLFELRCALVHGEAFSIKDWRGFSKYRRIFSSDPLKDVSDMAMKGLRLYFNN